MTVRPVLVERWLTSSARTGVQHVPAITKETIPLILQWSGDNFWSSLAFDKLLGSWQFSSRFTSLSLCVLWRVNEPNPSLPRHHCPSNSGVEESWGLLRLACVAAGRKPTRPNSSCLDQWTQWHAAQFMLCIIYFVSCFCSIFFPIVVVFKIFSFFSISHYPLFMFGALDALVP